MKFYDTSTDEEEAVPMLFQPQNNVKSTKPLVKRDLSYFETLLGACGFCSSSANDAFGNSYFASIVLLLNNMIGAGFLVQPSVFESSGIIVATLMYIMFSMTTFGGSQLLIAMADYSNSQDFSVIVLHALGPIGAVLLDISVIVFYFGAILTYTLMLGSLSQSVITDIFTLDIIPWYLSEPVFTVFWTLLVILPCCLARKYGQLVIIAYYSIAMALFATLLVCVEGPYFYYDKYKNDDIKWFSPMGGLRSVGSVIFALGFAPAVLHTYSTANRECRTHFTSIAFSTTIIGTLICYLVGVIGYLTFRSSTQADILQNFSGHIATLCKIGVLFHFNFLIPGYFIVMRSSLYHLMQMMRNIRSWLFSLSSHSVDRIQRAVNSTEEEYFNLEDIADSTPTDFVTVTGVMLLVITITACLVEAFFGQRKATISYIIDVTGGIAGSIIFFIVPAWCGICDLHGDRRWLIQSWVILIVGVVTACLVTIVSII